MSAVLSPGYHSKLVSAEIRFTLVSVSGYELKQFALATPLIQPPLLWDNYLQHLSNAAS